jgi:hypothetical protein
MPSRLVESHVERSPLARQRPPCRLWSVMPPEGFESLPPLPPVQEFGVDLMTAPPSEKNTGCRRVARFRAGPGPARDCNLLRDEVQCAPLKSVWVCP